MAAAGSSRNGNDEDWEAIVKEEMKQQTEEQTQIAHNLCYYAQNGKVQDLQNVATSQNCNHRCGEYGGTALIYAAESDSSNAPDAVRLLLQLGANVNLRSTEGKTALWKAAWAGNEEIAQILLNAGADPNCACSSGHAPLIVAIASNKDPPAAAVAAIVKNLLQKGADPFARRDDDGRNALWWARKEKYDEAASALLTAMNRTDWKSAARNEMQQQTEEQNEVVKQLVIHAYHGNIEELKKQVTTQNCDCRHDPNAMTLLMIAAISDSSNATEIVDFLLQLGASLVKRDEYGDTVLHYAANAGNTDVVGLLTQKARFLIEAQNNMGSTALIIATGSNKTLSAAAVAAVVEALLEEGADPFARRDDGCDALYWAEKKEFIDAARLLRSAMDKQKQQKPQQPEDQKKSHSANRPKFYPISKKPGICLIINNNKYHSMSQRKGSEFDVRNIQRTFSALNFNMRLHSDLTAEEILDTFYNFRKSKPKADMLICFIMGHGCDGAVIGVDGKVQMYSDIANLLSPVNCPSLAEKPKIFFVQACRVQMNSEQRSLSEFDADSVPKFVPHGVHFQFTYATTKNNIAIRDTKVGSPFIASLCKVVQEQSRNWNLEDMILEVKEEMKDRATIMSDGTTFYMVAETHSTLTKHVALRRRLLPE